MIPNQWYPILESRALRRRPVPLRRVGLDLVLFRGSDGAPRCLLDRCPHRGAALHIGHVVGDTLACRFHGLRFDGQGRCVALPCDEPDAKIPAGLDAEALHACERHGLVWIWCGAEPSALGLEALPEPSWFPELSDGTSGFSTVSEILPGHAQRWTESLFDHQHSEFIHGIPSLRFGTRVGLAEVTTLGPDRFVFHGTLVPTPGTRQRAVDLSFSFAPPCLVLITSEGLPFFSLTSDCPVDEGRTWRFLRQHYRPPRPWPMLGNTVAWFLIAFGWRVVTKWQDLPAVSSQDPSFGADKLLRPDAGIIRYRQIRQRLQQEALALEDRLPRPIRAALHQSLGSMTTPDDRKLVSIRTRRSAHDDTG